MSKRPPFCANNDARHLRVSSRHGSEHGATVGDDAVSCSTLDIDEIDLRLRPMSTSPVLPLAGRHTILASLVDPRDQASRLRITYALRKRVPLEVAISVARSFDRSGAIQHHACRISKRSLESLCQCVFPGMAAVKPSMPMLIGANRQLRGPAIDVLAPEIISQTRTQPKLTDPVKLASLHIPPGGAPQFTLDRALVGLSEAGFEVDLVIDVNRFLLGAEDLRMLEEAQRLLIARTYSAGSNGDSSEMLAEVECWIQTHQPVLQVNVSLRFPNEPDLAALSIAQALLFDGAKFFPDARPRGSDLSSCVLSSAPVPNMVVHPIAVGTISEVARRSRPRAPRGDVVNLGVDELGQAVTVKVDDLQQHLYVVGQTGVGKSRLLRDIALADAKAGRPFVMVDPHGDLHAEVLDALPQSIRSRAIIADAGDFDAPFSLNILEVKGPYAAIQRNFIANQLVGLFKSVYGHNPEAFGPMFEAYFRGALFLLMDAGGPDATLLDLERVFGDGSYRRGLLEKCTDPTVTSFWRNIAQRAGGEASIENIAPYITSKLSQLAGNPLLRPILCTPRTTLDIPSALADGRTVLVNLAKGLTGGDAGILGGIVTIRLFAAAMDRARLPPAERRLTRVILDEFQTFGAVSVLSEALAEVRKYGLSIVLANQSISQIDGRAGDIAHAILGNIGNLAVFRVGPKDAAMLAEWLGQEISPETLLRLPNHTGVARLLRGGEPMPSVTFRTGMNQKCR
jgi:hypothetical protein